MEIDRRLVSHVMRWNGVGIRCGLHSVCRVDVGVGDMCKLSVEGEGERVRTCLPIVSSLSMQTPDGWE